MNRALYSLLIRLLAPGLLVWMLLRARRAGGDWDVFAGARFGRYRCASTGGAIWVHAVSLGETRAAQPLIRALLERGHRVLLTHLTATGRAEGARTFADALAAGQLVQEWLPYDFPGATRRFIAHHRPALAVLIEREVWPNLVHATAAGGIPLVLASARMSAASLRRSRRAGSVMREAYGRFRTVYAQSLSDARRLERAGAAGVCVSGNFKFDIRLDPERIARGREFARRLGRRAVALASIREPEEAVFLRALRHAIERQQQAEPEEAVLFYLIPRHPQRFEALAMQLREAGLAFERRSHLIELGDGSSSAVQACRDVPIVLGDTLGELPWYYAASQAAIVGGSFAPLGGQNFIEACALGVPVVVGPHTANFEQAVLDALAAGAIERADDPDKALQRILRWLDEPRELARMGQAASAWVQDHTGAVARVLNGLEALLAD